MTGETIDLGEKEGGDSSIAKQQEIIDSLALGANELKQDLIIGALITIEIQNALITSLLQKSINPIVYSAPVQVNVDENVTTILAANPLRRGYIISNENGKKMWSSINGTPVVEGTIEIDKKVTFTHTDLGLTTQDIKGICKSGENTIVTVQEGL